MRLPVKKYHAVVHMNRGEAETIRMNIIEENRLINKMVIHNAIREEISIIEKVNEILRSIYDIKGDSN